MAVHPVTPITPPLIDDERFATNGMVPNASHMKRLAEGFNFVASRCKKQFFLRCQPLNGVDTGSASLEYWWYSTFHAGENTTGITYAVGLAATDLAFTVPPELTIEVRDSAGSSLIASAVLKFSSSGVALAAPDNITQAEGRLVGLTPNTTYTTRFILEEGVRLVYASLTESDTRHADDTVTAVCDPGEYTAEGPIYDAHLADLIEANNDLWRHNGAHLINWCATGDADVSSPTVVATSYTNVLDLSSTAVSSATPGWDVFTIGHNTINRTTVPVKMRALVQRITGTGALDLQLTDGTNTLTIAGSSGAGDQWVEAAGTIPDAKAKWDLHALVSSGSWMIKCMALFEYEA